MTFWERLDQESVRIDEVDYIPVVEVKLALLRIKERVNDIVDGLGGITGLTEINELYTKACKLSDEIY